VYHFSYLHASGLGPWRRTRREGRLLDTAIPETYIFSLSREPVRHLKDMTERDEFFMRLALAAADEAGRRGEVPVGACVVDPEGEVLATEGNSPIGSSDPTAHAEVMALRAAGLKTGNYRLTGCTVYTTIEPCVMCSGALVNARIGRLVYGAADERFGAARSVFRLCDSSSLNHQIEVVPGVLEAECSNLMSGFFERLRAVRGRGESS